MLLSSTAATTTSQAVKMRALSEGKTRQRTYHQPAAEDHHEAYLHGETLIEGSEPGLHLHPS